MPALTWKPPLGVGMGFFSSTRLTHRLGTDGLGVPLVDLVGRTDSIGRTGGSLDLAPLGLDLAPLGLDLAPLGLDVRVLYDVPGRVGPGRFSVAAALYDAETSGFGYTFHGTAPFKALHPTFHYLDGFLTRRPRRLGRRRLSKRCAGLVNGMCSLRRIDSGRRTGPRTRPRCPKWYSPSTMWATKMLRSISHFLPAYTLGPTCASLRGLHCELASVLAIRRPGWVSHGPPCRSTMRSTAWNTGAFRGSHPINNIVQIVVKLF